MKKLYLMLFSALVAVMAISSCKKAEPFYTAGEDDYPRILNTTFSQTGEPNTFPSIYRDENFTFELVVTPAQYTTVNWYIDGEMVFEGNNIDINLLAGVHDVVVTATTTKGKQTQRDATLEVLALATDPALASDAKSRWLQIGTTPVISGSNIENVVKAYLQVREMTKANTLLELDNFTNTGKKVSFDVPEVAEGSYQIILETAEGELFGAGAFTVSPDKYVDPGVKEVVLWEGATDINWGDSNVQLSAAELAEVPAGATIVLTYEMIEADYHALRVTNQDWSSDLVAQVDEINVGYPDGYEFTYTADCIAAVGEGSMVITGFGYKLTKVVARTGGAVETALWEGATDINWGDSNVQLSAAELAAVPAGAKIVLTYEIIEADYHALRVTNQDWSSDLVAQVDEINVGYPDGYEFVYTADCIAAVGEGSMVITGFGYKLTKVTYVVGGAPAETTIWEGDTDINWGDSNVQLSAEDLAGVAEGQTIVLTYQIIEADYHALRVTNQDWSSDLVAQVDEINVGYPDGYEFTYTADCIAAVGEGSMVVTGFGYKLTKVTVK